MPFLIAISVALQFVCLIHLVRTGRPYWWIWLIMLGQFLGAAVYIITQIIPDLRNDPSSRRMVRDVARRIDPERERRRIAQELEVADTVENRRRLAEESLRLGDYANAAELYRSILKGFYATDPLFLYSLAQAQIGLEQYAGARDTLDTLIQSNPQHQSVDVHFMMARCLEELGENDRAVREYEALSTSYPGEEARLRYGQLLKRLGRLAEARNVFESMQKRAKVSPAYYRRKEKAFLAEAQRELTNLSNTS
ncbi:tetratricopeptide repeat protein [Tahibacter amnicola]|uniref:Tetratricopeptide repeat protein n=1 Tax=Tahibacter amnicola TaxID=2976241 RepID=A0ABY6BLD5_9GAMM|nr:tetratricopeptide repeat protein [Tahibacter amnicola]UXI68622.1 tetratricopeptide repeat protein [Tahibacter amnicola]